MEISLLQNSLDLLCKLHKIMTIRLTCWICLKFMVVLVCLAWLRHTRLSVLQSQSADGQEMCPSSASCNSHCWGWTSQICYCLCGHPRQFILQCWLRLRSSSMCLKACFVFNLSYPLPARSAWTQLALKYRQWMIWNPIDSWRCSPVNLTNGIICI